MRSASDLSAEARKRKPKGGADLWDFAKFEQGVGIIVREIDNAGRPYKAISSPEAKRLKDNLKTLMHDFKAWCKDLKKATAK